jgi:hypothetical protein
LTDHKHLIRDTLGSTSDWVYKWRLLLEEYRPKIVYIKGIHNTAADAITQLEYDPSVNQIAESYFLTKVNKSSKHSQRQNWMEVSKYWCELEIATNKHEELNLVFANHKEVGEIHPLAIIGTIEAKKKDQELKIYYARCENTNRVYTF